MKSTQILLPSWSIPSSLFLYTNSFSTSTPLVIFGPPRWHWVVMLWALTALEMELNTEVSGLAESSGQCWVRPRGTQQWGSVLRHISSSSVLSTVMVFPHSKDKRKLNRAAAIPRARSSLLAIVIFLRTSKGCRHTQWFIVLYPPNLKDTNKFLRACLFPRLVEIWFYIYLDI